ncbi:uncharacterized protein [Temnothorax longispinosus]|uniref:uncharacterized protein n=1 Tax=Temnothorax longispinosus TaxID=300112 RepID=UPI003A99DF6C
MRRRKESNRMEENLADKEEAQIAARKREETGWIKEITRELREIGHEIKEEIRRTGMEVKEELRKLKTQPEAEEKRMAEEKEERGEEGWSEGWGRDWSEGSTDSGGRITEGTDNGREDKKNREAKQDSQGRKRAAEKKGDGGREKSEKEWRRPPESDRRKEQEEERNRLRRMIEEREEEIGRRREKREKEEERKKERERKEKTEKRKKNLIWRRVAGEGPKERREMLEAIMEKVTGREIMIRKAWEVTGVDGKIVIFTELEEEEDKEEVIERCDEIWRRWEIGVDEELTLEERAYRHKLVERAREERTRGNAVVLTNRRMWINGREVKWEEERGGWRRM